MSQIFISKNPIKIGCIVVLILLYYPLECQTVLIPKVKGVFINQVTGEYFTYGIVKAERNHASNTEFDSTIVRQDGTFIFNNLVVSGKGTVCFRGFCDEKSGVSSGYSPDLILNGRTPIDSVIVDYNPYFYPDSFSLKERRLSGEIRGRIIDQITKKGIPNAKIHVEVIGKVGGPSSPPASHMLNYNVETDSNGYYRLTRKALYFATFGDKFIDTWTPHGISYINILSTSAPGFKSSIYIPKEASSFRIANNIYMRNFELKPKEQVALPNLLEKREIVWDKAIGVSNSQIAISIWDYNKIDGDTISLNFNGRWILKDFLISKKKKKLLLDLENDDNYLILHAENEGTEPPNTAAISIRNEKDEEIIIKLSSNNRLSAAIKIRRNKKIKK